MAICSLAVHAPWECTGEGVKVTYTPLCCCGSLLIGYFHDNWIRFSCMCIRVPDIYRIEKGTRRALGPPRSKRRKAELPAEEKRFANACPWYTSILQFMA